MSNTDAIPVAFVLDGTDYAVLTGALTEYADEMLLRANECGPNAGHFHESAQRARRMVETVEQPLDAS